MSSDFLPLRDGARIGIIGGGPAGSLFAHFLLRYAQEANLRLQVTIYDGKSFARRGTAGCNMCAGVIAKNFAENLKAIGVQLPNNVVQRYIGGYSLITPVGTVHLRQKPGDILTVYRGNGPRGATYRGNISFDDHLLESAKLLGVAIIPEYVTGIELPSRREHPIRLTYGRKTDGRTEEVDLVVGAFGLNSAMVRQVKALGFGYRPPESMSSSQVEIELGSEHIQNTLGNNIYVYALRLPGVKFAAITPKHDYLTVTLVGQEVMERGLTALLDHPKVRPLLPPNWRMPPIYCRCHPRVAVGSCRRPYHDRLVIIGDASDSRLYKNGLESSLVTARAAAATAVRYGVSRQAFEKHYYPTCRAIARDSVYGRVLFWANDLLLSSDFTTRVLVNAARNEQNDYPSGGRAIGEILWHVLTGDRPYRAIFFEALSPGFQRRVFVEGIIKGDNWYKGSAEG